MSTENGIHIVTREEFLVGQRVETVTRECDGDGINWTVLYLENGRVIYITDDAGWVLVEPQVN